jgi:hypothetical protein
VLGTDRGRSGARGEPGQSERSTRDGVGAVAEKNQLREKSGGSGGE